MLVGSRIACLRTEAGSTLSHEISLKGSSMGQLNPKTSETQSQHQKIKTLNPEIYQHPPKYPLIEPLWSLIVGI